MHHHGYLWTGPKARFDQEALRRPPHPEPPPPGSRPELIARYREVTAEFPVSDLPPLETAYWLLKPGSLVRGTWHSAQESAAWVRRQLDAFARRFAGEAQSGQRARDALVASVVERLAAGGDVSLGFYLERPAYLSLSLVTCSPNRARPELPCPLPESTIAAPPPSPTEHPHHHDHQRHRPPCDARPAGQRTAGRPRPEGGHTRAPPDRPGGVRTALRDLRALGMAPRDAARLRVGPGGPVLRGVHRNAATGEDVRNLWRAEAMRARLPGEDFWIFDSRLVAVLDFDDDDTLLGIEAITEPGEVLRYCQVRDAAMHHAIAYDEFAAQVARTDEPAVRPPSPAGPLLTVDVAAVPPRTAPPPRPPAPPPPT